MKHPSIKHRFSVWYHPVRNVIDMLDEQASNQLEFVDVLDARMSAEFMGWIEIGDSD